MKLAFYIARRYLLARKSHTAIQIISVISVCSVAIATVALVCILSAFNGFNELVASMFSRFDPELRITPATGKVFEPDTAPIRRIRALPQIALCTEVLQENVLVRYHTEQHQQAAARQEVAVGKGVSDEFLQAVSLDSLLIAGQVILHDGDVSCAMLGVGLAHTLGIYGQYSKPLEIYAPDREATVNVANPAGSFRMEYAFIGGVFAVYQATYDERTMLLPIRLMRSLLGYDTEVSALELKLADGADIAAVKQQIQAMAGDGFRVDDRYQQQEASFKMMQIEKWVTFLILTFVLTIALFSVVSSLLMLMIEKKEDVQMLRSMGADDRLIRRIFLLEGIMIPLSGALIGCIIGIALCLLQQTFGLLRLGDHSGIFVNDYYPIRIHFIDIMTILLTVSAVGFLVAWYPVRYFSKKWLGRSWMAALLALPLLLTGCGNRTEQRPTLSLTMEPQRYFASRIAGDRFDLFVVVPAGQSPETYDPAPGEMMRIAQSTAYLQIGRIGFEQVWMETIRENNPNVRFFDLSEGVEWLEGTCHHHHGDEGHEHHHHDTDPHIWNAIGTAQVIARNTFDALVAVDPEGEATYRTNFDRLTAEIDSTGRLLHQRLDTLTHRTFVIYHPALTYFAHEFGLTQLSIEEDGKEPSAASMKRLVDTAREAGVRVVFVQQEFDRKHAEQLAAAIGARIVPINPLSADWSNEMLKMADELCR